MIYKIEFRAMGSHVLAALETNKDDSCILKQVPTWFSRWERKFSRFLPDSELARLNRSRGQSVKVSRDLLQVIKMALKNRAASQGMVSPFLLDSLEYAGYSSSFENLDSQNHSFILPSEFPLDEDDLIINEADHSVRLGRTTRLDLGGVAKGWAAHQAMLRLKKYGACLVDAGGDIATSGPLADGSPWPVGISDPFQNIEQVTLLALSGQSVATSGRDYRNWMFNGSRQHHLIDPRTHAPAKNDVLTATVLAHSVLQAELAAKTAFLLGSDEGMQWLAQNNHPALLILADGRQATTPDFGKYLWNNQ